MGDQSFWELCQDGDIEEVQAAIDNGADVNEATLKGATGLMWALREGHNNVVQLLLHNPQTDFNKVDINGCSALHEAVAVDNHEGMEALLARHDDLNTIINQRNRWGETLIITAVCWNSVNCFHLLLTNPLVDLDTRDDYERTSKEVHR